MLALRRGKQLAKSTPDRPKIPAKDSPGELFVEGWLGGRDSNPDSAVQSRMSYHWTTSQQEVLQANESRDARQPGLSGSQTLFERAEALLDLSSLGKVGIKLHENSQGQFSLSQASLSKEGFELLETLRDPLLTTTHLLEP